MKETRQFASKCETKSLALAHEPIKKMGLQSDISQWIFIGPEDALKPDGENGVFARLPHPHKGLWTLLGVPSLFLFQDDRIYEVMKFSERFHSWFIEDSVQSDGTLHVLTPIDPLFICLPFLEKASHQGKYMALDAVLVDSICPSIRRLEQCLSRESLLNVCDCRCADELVAYKFDSEKALRWMSIKVEQLRDHLKNSKISVGSGAQVSNFNRGSAKDEGECLRYAWTLVSDYLEPQWSLQLKEKLGITDPVKEPAAEPPAKKQKTSDDPKDMVVEDYREPQSKTPSSKKTTAKLSAGQRQLQRVDKKGMKTMTSFFTTRSKTE